MTVCFGGVIAVAVGVLQRCGPRRESHLEDVKERNKESHDHVALCLFEISQLLTSKIGSIWLLSVVCFHNRGVNFGNQWTPDCNTEGTVVWLFRQYLHPSSRLLNYTCCALNSCVPYVPRVHLWFVKVLQNGCPSLLIDRHPFKMTITAEKSSLKSLYSSSFGSVCFLWGAFFSLRYSWRTKPAICIYIFYHLW